MVVSRPSLPFTKALVHIHTTHIPAFHHLFLLGMLAPLSHTECRSSHPRQWLLHLGSIAKCLQAHWSPRCWWNLQGIQQNTCSSALHPGIWDPAPSFNFPDSGCIFWCLGHLPKGWRADFALTFLPRVLQSSHHSSSQWLGRLRGNRIPHNLLWHHRIPEVTMQIRPFYDPGRLSFKASC